MPSWLDTALVAAALSLAAGYVWRRHRAPRGCGACPAAPTAGPAKHRSP